MSVVLHMFFNKVVKLKTKWRHGYCSLLWKTVTTERNFTAVNELQTRSRSLLTFCGTQASMAARALTKGICS